MQIVLLGKVLGDGNLRGDLRSYIHVVNHELEQSSGPGLSSGPLLDDSNNHLRSFSQLHAQDIQLKAKVKNGPLKPSAKKMALKKKAKAFKDPLSSYAPALDFILSSEAPSVIQVLSQTSDPSNAPTLIPSNKPILALTNKPTLAPTNKPTLAPSFQPSNQPTFAPSAGPSLTPSFEPSPSPSLAPSFEVLSTFYNGDFAIGQERSSQIPGWTFYSSRVQMNGLSTIRGFPTPNDPTPSPENTPYADGTDPSNLYFVTLYKDPFAYIVLTNLGGYLNSKCGISRGPYIVSDSIVQINAGSTIQFEYLAALKGPNDFYDVSAYLLEANTGNTILLADDTQSGASSWTTVTHVATDAEVGVYYFVFISGTVDASCDGFLSPNFVNLRNIRVLPVSSIPTI